MKRNKDTENKLVVTSGEREGGGAAQRRGLRSKPLAKK